jgi:sortase (surface protein transpeptidase)
VFAQLSRASIGSQVVVAGAAGDVPFLVTSIDRYAKADFPTELVYKPTERAELRLITCGGWFDERTGHYADNVVVTAVRV